MESDRQAQHQPRPSRGSLPIQPRKHLKQRSRLLVPRRPARVLLQPGHARAVLYSYAARRAAGHRYHSSASTARWIIRFPAHPVQTVHPDGKDGHLLLSNNYRSSVTDYAFTPQLGHDVHGQPRHRAALFGRPLRARTRNLPSAVQRQGQQSRLRSLSSLLAVRLHDAASQSARPVLGQLRRSRTNGGSKAPICRSR